MPNLIKLNQKPTLEEVAASLQFPVKTKLDERPKVFDSLVQTLQKSFVFDGRPNFFNPLKKTLQRSFANGFVFAFKKKAKHLFTNTRVQTNAREKPSVQQVTWPGVNEIQQF